MKGRKNSGGKGREGEEAEKKDKVINSCFQILDISVWKNSEDHCTK